MPELPSGTVTFLFTDIEGSTALWERDAAAMRVAVARHLALLDDAIAAHGGIHYKTIGDAIQAAFPSERQALAAAVEALRALLSEPWDGTGPLHVRMALHTGVAAPRDGDYLAPMLNHLARLLAAGHGDQILLSEAAQALARVALPPEIALRDLGVHHLRDLLAPERVYQALHPALPAEFPALKSLDARPTNLPRQPTLFIGRERELHEMLALLRERSTRLLTLTGPGGTGKTRLALQAAAELLDDIPDGVHFVPLAALTDAADVPVAIEMALGLRESPGQTPREQLLAALVDKRMLLVLDNLEHLLDAAPFVGELLTAAPGVTILVTSRARLRLRAEREYVLSPLPLPREPGALSVDAAEGYDAVRLFVDRAQAVKPDFALTTDNALVVAEIVRRLDGLPLAIELDAARIRLFTPTAMVARLDNPLPLLTGGARDLPARQQTLRQTIAWSHDLLTTDEQTVFRRLALFPGGFTLEAAEAVLFPSPSVLDGLERLVEHSLLQRHDADDGDATPRFGMLETIREYGLERLAESGELAAAREHYVQFFLDLAEQRAHGFDGPDQGALLDQLETEHDNLRAALEWADDHPDAAARLRLAAALWPFWDAHGHFSEGRAWLERVLAREPAGPPVTLATALTGAGNIARLQGDIDRARELLEQALAMWQDLGDRRREARALIAIGHAAERQGDLDGATVRFEAALAIGRAIDDVSVIGSAVGNLGIIADEQGNFPLAVARYEEALAIFRATGDRRREAAALDNLGIAARAQGDLVAAKRRYEEAMDVRREIADAWGLAATLGHIGVIAHQSGDLLAAQEHYEQSLAAFRALGDRRAMANTLGNLGIAARQMGDLSRAATLHREGLLLVAEIGDRVGIATGLEGVAAVAASAGDAVPAARLFAAADAIRADTEAPVPPDDRPDHERSLALIRDRLDDAAFDRAWAAAESLTQEEAIAEALAVELTNAPATA